MNIIMYIIVFMTLGYFIEFVGINALSISVLFYEHPNKAFINHGDVANHGW